MAYNMIHASFLATEILDATIEFYRKSRSSAYFRLLAKRPPTQPADCHSLPLGSGPGAFLADLLAMLSRTGTYKMVGNGATKRQFTYLQCPGQGPSRIRREV